MLLPVWQDKSQKITHSIIFNELVSCLLAESLVLLLNRILYPDLCRTLSKIKAVFPSVSQPRDGVKITPFIFIHVYRKQVPPPPTTKMHSCFFSSSLSSPSSFSSFTSFSFSSLSFVPGSGVYNLPTIGS